MNEMNRPDAWLSCTLAALRAIEDSRFDDAASLWRDACTFADRLPHDDARRAAALSNLGLSEFIAGRREQAIAALAAAQNHWQGVETWVEQVDIPSTASSSMFHFLLAANHPDVITRLRRKKYLTICAGAAAMTESIHDQARGSNVGFDRIQSQAQSIRCAFGEDAIEAQTLDALATHRPVEKRSRLRNRAEERWRSVSNNTVVEMRPLVDAAYLTIGLTPELLDLARTRSD